MYEAIAPFYDDFAGSAQDRAEKVLSAIRDHAPGASSLVEFGCGSGLVLKEMPSAFELAGIDLSASLLARAAQRCPGAHLAHADICDVAVGRRFDVVTCIFDTLNHVSDVTRWSEVFATAARHLTAGGLFIFDVNTQSRLQRLGDAPPWVAPIEAGTLIMKINAEADTATFLWDIRVFEDLGDSPSTGFTTTRSERPPHRYRTLSSGSTRSSRSSNWSTTPWLQRPTIRTEPTSCAA